MVALLISGVALTAIVFTLQSNLTTADSLRDNTVATGLATEGLEVVRNIRDQEWMTSFTFGNNLPNGTYEVQWNSTALSSSTSRFLKKDSGSGIYSYDLGNDTFFKRTITISTASADEKIVSVSITWTLRGVAHTLSAESHLYNWY